MTTPNINVGSTLKAGLGGGSTKKFCRHFECLYCVYISQNKWEECGLPPPPLPTHMFYRDTSWASYISHGATCNKSIITVVCWQHFFLMNLEDSWWSCDLIMIVLWEMGVGWVGGCDIWLPPFLLVLSFYRKFQVFSIIFWFFCLLFCNCRPESYANLNCICIYRLKKIT